MLAAHLDNDINPVTQDYIDGQLDRAEDDGYDAFVLVLDTPGGLSSSMRGIVKRFLSAKVPVVVYVAPPGSSADSAGAVITMASDLAAMAPQTNIGSSTPISLGGEDISKDLRRKVINDAAAYIGELAREHDRNVQAAREMVTKASNFGARQALAMGIVEVVAPTLPALLDEIDGMKTIPKGYVLDTADADVTEVEMSFWQRARDLLVDPNLIAIMLSIGLLGIVVELWNPGLILPGHGRRDLADPRPVRTPGAPGVRRRAPAAGAVGRVLRRRGVRPDPRRARGRRRRDVRARRAHPLRPGGRGVPGVAARSRSRSPATLAVLLGIALTRVVRVARQPVAVGAHGLVGAEGTVKRDGLVQLNGELWRAHTKDGSMLVPGQHVRVEDVESDLRLVVGSGTSPSEEGTT